MTRPSIRTTIAALAAAAALVVTGATGVAAAAPIGFHSAGSTAEVDPFVTGTVVYAEDDGEDGDGPLDEDDCEQLEQTFNGAVEVGSNERAAGRWGGWNLMQSIAEDTYLDAQFGGCEWAAE